MARFYQRQLDDLERSFLLTSIDSVWLLFISRVDINVSNATWLEIVVVFVADSLSEGREGKENQCKFNHLIANRSAFFCH